MAPFSSLSYDSENVEWSLGIQAAEISSDRLTSFSSWAVLLPQNQIRTFERKKKKISVCQTYVKQH